MAGKPGTPARNSTLLGCWRAISWVTRQHRLGLRAPVARPALRPIATHCRDRRYARPVERFFNRLPRNRMRNPFTTCGKTGIRTQRRLCHKPSPMATLLLREMPQVAHARQVPLPRPGHGSPAAARRMWCELRSKPFAVKSSIGGLPCGTVSLSSPGTEKVSGTVVFIVSCLQTVPDTFSRLSR